MDNQDEREIYNLEQFKKFINENREKIYRIAEANTRRNEKGEVVITKEEAEEW
jgi:hypothetical protein